VTLLAPAYELHLSPAPIPPGPGELLCKVKHVTWVQTGEEIEISQHVESQREMIYISEERKVDFGAQWTCRNKAA
jgi:hypothetical protein